MGAGSETCTAPVRRDILPGAHIIIHNLLSKDTELHASQDFVAILNTNT